MNLNFIKNIVLTLFLGVATATAQTGVKQATIASINISGNVTSDAELIKLTTGLVEGQAFSMDDIQKAVENLWEINVFEDIQVYGEEVEKGIALYFVVKEFPRLSEIQIEGQDEIEKKDIREKIGLFVGQTVSPQKIKKARNKILKLYAAEGFLKATADLETFVSKADTGRVLLKVKIDEGKKVLAVDYNAALDWVEVLNAGLDRIFDYLTA